MIILFTKLNGEHVNTTDKIVLVEAAKNGEISPDAVVTIDGMGIEARRIKGLVFGDPPPAAPVNPPKPTAPAPAPKPAEKGDADPLPQSVRAAFEWLTTASVLLGWLAAFIWVLAGCAFLANDVIGVAVSSFVAAGCCIYSALFLSNILKILEYIVVNVTKKQ